MHSCGLALALIAGCYAYRGGFQGLRAPFPGEHVAFACLDLGVASVRDGTAAGPVIQYTLGNRCEHTIEVDLASVRVVARDRSGIDRVLEPYDPRHELRRLPFAPLMDFDQKIEYRGLAASEVAGLCVDVDRVADGATVRTACIAGAGS